MSILTTRPWLRWLVPVGVAIATIGGGAVVRAVAASADPTLPPRTAAQLLVDLQAARFTALSGTVTQRADLGLPSLPSNATQGSTSLWSLATGAHTLRVWYAGPDNGRVALLGTFGETDVIKYGHDMWIWDSKRNTATHYKLNAQDAPGAPSRDSLEGTVPTSPRDLAEFALSALDPTTEVRTDGSAKVAGRSAYELVLEPKDKTSLVARLRFAIDAERHVPLRVTVYAKGSDKPAIAAGFTDVSFARPDAAQFRFNPPPGAQVIEANESDAKERSESGEKLTPRTTVVGTGWTSVFVTRIPDDAIEELRDGANGAVGLGGSTTGEGSRDGNKGAQSAAALDVLGALPKVSGSWGSGRMLSSKMFSVLITDDGRLLAGLVTSERLTQVAADPAAAVKGEA